MSQDFIALEWVKGEIEETLNQAQQALEAYVENPEDKSRLTFCLNYMHQINGTLKIVEFYGAALLAEEMESVALALTQGAIQQEQVALEALMQAIIQLPNYLEHIKVGHRDLPVVLLPILNDLRSARGDNFLSETALFTPTISVNPPLTEAQKQSINSQEFHQWMRKIRQMVQTATLQLIQDKQPDIAKQYLNKALARLDKTLGKTPQGNAWLAGLAFSEWLQKQEQFTSSARYLLRHIDGLLKETIDLGEESINRPAPEELVKNLLFYVANTDVKGEAIKRAQQQFNLADALLNEQDIEQQRAQLSGPDKTAIESVLGALVAEIVIIKDQLDLLVRNENTEERKSALLDASNKLKQTADTMAMLGLGMPRSVIQEQQNNISNMLETENFSDEALLDIAGALLYVEATLQGMQAEGSLSDQGTQGSLSDAQQAVLREARNGLEQTKDSIVAYIANQWAVEELKDLPALLHSIAGSLAMIPMPEAGAILSLANRFIEEELIAKSEQPKWSVMDTFADVLSSIEYYLERYSGDQQQADLILLEKAEEALYELTGEYAYRNQSSEELEPEIEATDLADESSTESIEQIEVETATEEIVEEDDDDLIDDEILEIFLEEAEEVYETLEESWPQYKANKDDSEALTTVRRAFHTLKGSGRMVKASAISELAWSIENMLNRLLDQSINLSEELTGLIDRVLPVLPTLIKDFEAKQKASIDPQPLMDEAFAIADGKPIPTTDQANETETEVDTAETESQEESSETVEIDNSDAPVLDETINHETEEHIEIDEVELAEDELGETLIEIFISETEGHLETIDAFIAESELNSYAIPLPDTLQRALHTLKGSAHMADIICVANIANPLEKLVKDFRAYQLPNSADISDLISIGANLIRQAISDKDLLNCESVTGTEELIESIKVLSQNKLSEHEHNLELGIGPSSQDIAQFLSHGMEALLDADMLLQQWQENQDQSILLALRDDLQQVAEDAEKSNLTHIQTLAKALDDFYSRIIEQKLEADELAVDLAATAQEELLGMLDYLAAGQETLDPQATVQQLNSWEFEIASSEKTVDESSIEEIEIALPEIEEVELTAVVDEPQEDPSSSFEFSEEDREILEIFIEEVDELNESLEVSLHQWQENNDDQDSINEILRVLHTLKGGARLSGLTDIGDITHDFETDILKVKHSGIKDSEQFFSHAYAQYDLIVNKVEKLRAALEGREDPTEIESVEPVEIDDNSTETNIAETETETDLESIEPDSADTDADSEIELETEPAIEEKAPQPDNVVTLPSVKIEPIADTIPVAPQPQPVVQQQSRTKTPQEFVRVSADLLDDMVNLAGETSIGRGRLEQQVNDFSHTLEEMDVTLDRLRDQLRRLDMETEAQVLFRQERQGPDYEDFDPLEMDRYSTIQQLSRALVESTSDLLDLKETLTNKNRDAETLLLQQSRINSELQEGLMQSRMVPFQQMVPRLRRIVRQIGQELDKKVELHIQGASGEMDRSILERLTSPLEHMLRNAVDHGIEDTNERATSGKDPVGCVEIDISRDGGDVIIRINDDGKGVNIAAVRKKAIERGLIEEDSPISDQEVLQFILHAGFSTAAQVTQISGRGVGMDVVDTEIKQLGGSVEIQSEAGQGTSFIVRIPFTVSVNRALMIRMGEDLYAVPLNNIQGIARIPVGELFELYKKPIEERIYHYAGVDYQLSYLGNLLDTIEQPELLPQTLPIPVLLVRGSVPHALQVDSLLGSREIVVKTLGPQFATVMGVSGGTILGDGSVVIILDLPALIRANASREHQQARELELQAAQRRQLLEERLPTIMVVDDSVTVRKVTSRLLERNGMEVLTAKDGIDAITSLQEHIPDLILLDIEMPRMDGFEVASQVRHSSRLKHIPIIMITSRTGDKHRERAMSIGVNEYLGKPFQEDILLAKIGELLGHENN